MNKDASTDVNVLMLQVFMEMEDFHVIAKLWCSIKMFLQLCN